MVSEAVEETLEEKTPVMRGTGSHEKSFTIRATQDSEGVQAEITNVVVEDKFAPMHFDPRWSTEDNRETPFQGSRFPTRDQANQRPTDKYSDDLPRAIVPVPEIHVVFDIATGETRHFRWSGTHAAQSDFLHTLIIDGQPAPNPDHHVEGRYRPTSETGGELEVCLGGTTATASRRAYEGEPDAAFDANALQRAQAWVSYQSRKDDWVECPVVNAYDDEAGDELVLVVESPLGSPTAFTFEVTPDEATPYWTVVNELAAGDPAELAAADSVYLRHHSFSFYQYDPKTVRNLTKQRTDGVLSIDVDNQWELRVTAPSRLESVTPSPPVRDVSAWRDALSRVVAKVRGRTFVHRAD